MNPWTPKRDYFQKTANISSDGMYYMSGTYKSKEFIDWQHPLGEVVSGAAGAGFAITTLTEEPLDVLGLFEKHQNKGIPLSYILEAFRI